ncbi:S41 family peptidase [Beggiatoa leptomitoformis]|uniref:PDZ domain-containing protein n=1 Tax=Beggiatoa leptomitoformis TaxID=288004 RepID=A0A2N9Y9Y0_9GAMM|nr:S41 family peptidase [Beggiatoa leptomitoformis]ALG67307.1 PDZ domain-containing protein [Beggiatoa leptomitoformis]AUI67261.1 PDZ domain-containing protein [Beggiatoa leptomitoformis]
MNIFSRQLPTLVAGTVLGSFVAFTFLGTNVFAERDASTKSIPFEDLRAFTEVFHRIKSSYVESVDDKTLLQNAIQGMLSGLDPHSSYLTEDAYQELQVGTTGEFGGLGIEVGMEDGFVKVISPIDDTPAQKAGVQAGDMIIRLDETPVKGLSLTEAVKLMRGKPGSNIKLTVARENEDKPITINIVRDIIQVKSIRSNTLEPGYVYLRISQFQAHTGDDLEKAIDTLKQENKDGIKGLILDLRNNPGGVLNAAVAISDAFITDGLIVYTEGRTNDAHLQFKARPDDLLNGAPIVVLVNGGSASASEIVAGALQDHKRAIIMGEKTFGKGSVQTILPMGNNAALKLTTARYYTPSGRSIQAEGIIPDIPLKRLELAETKTDDLSLREADLARHLNKTNKAEEVTKALEAEDLKNGKQPAKTTEKSKEEEKPLAQRDYAVHEALNLLKGLIILEARKSAS